VNGRQEIVAFLTRKWVKELDYRLIKELWAFTSNRIAVRFAYELSYSRIKKIKLQENASQGLVNLANQV